MTRAQYVYVYILHISIGGRGRGGGRPGLALALPHRSDCACSLSVRAGAIQCQPAAKCAQFELIYLFICIYTERAEFLYIYIRTR